MPTRPGTAIALALTTLTAITVCSCDRTRARAEIEAARAVAGEGRHEDAVAMLEHALELDASLREGWVLLARSRWRSDDPMGAVDALDRAGDLGPPTADERALRDRAERRVAERAAAAEREQTPEIAQRLGPLPGTADAIEAHRRASIADRSAIAPRIELARLWLDEDAATQAERFCPTLRVPQGDGDGSPEPTPDPRAIDGEACLEAVSPPCEPRIAARQILERARETATAVERETISELLARATALDTSRAQMCSMDGLVARFGAPAVMRSSRGAERALEVHDPRAVGAAPSTPGSRPP